MMKKWVLGGIIGLFVPMSVLAFGMVTKPIQRTDVLRGQSFEETLVVFNSDSQERTIALSAEEDIATWVAFEDPKQRGTKITEILMEPSAQKELVAIISVPSDTPNGTYYGYISVTKKPDPTESQEGATTSVSQKVSRSVTITVSDKEIVALETSVIPEKYEVSKGEFLKVTVVYENQGNISLEPSLKLKIQKDGQEASVHDSIFPYPEDEEAVGGLSTKRIEYDFPTGNLPEGKYIARMEVMNDDESLEKHDFSFFVGDSGTVLGAEETSDAVKDGSSISSFSTGMIGLMVVTIVILAIVLGVIVKMYRRS